MKALAGRVSVVWRVGVGSSLVFCGYVEIPAPWQVNHQGINEKASFEVRGGIRSYAGERLQYPDGEAVGPAVGRPSLPEKKGPKIATWHGHRQAVAGATLAGL